MSFEIKVPLEDWEKALLENARQQYDTCISQDNNIPPSRGIEAFGNWAWAVHVKDILHEMFIDAEENDTVQPRSWKIVCEKLSSRGASHSTPNSYHCHSRFKSLLRENPKLEHLFGKSDNQNFLDYKISIVPTDQDIDYWELVAALINFVSSHHDNADSLRDGYGVEDIISEDLTQTVEQETFEQYLNDSTKISLSRTPTADDFPDLDTDEEWMNLLGKFDIWKVIYEVTTSIREIHDDIKWPWAQLVEHEPVDLNSFACKLEYIPISKLHLSGKLGCEGSILLWKPEVSTILNHHIFTEDELYGYCVNHQFGLPGYREHGAIVYIARELTLLELRQHTKHLQTMYNDCAITLDPISGKPYLLETQPGRKYRNITNELGLQAARGYFRAIVDRTRLGRDLRLRDVLQHVDREISWVNEEKYEGLIDAIPFSEISLINERARGTGGEVYFGKWVLTQKKLGMAQLQDKDVVLKRIWPPTTRSRQMLIHELQNSIRLLATKPIGSIGLYGITLVPSTHKGVVAPGSVFLVLARAQKLEEYLTQKLTGSPSDWDIISELFRDIAASLNSLHVGRNSVIHRDIHKDNIVMQQVACPNDPFDSTYPELVIIDLGESQRKDLTTQSINMYGNPDYWAPEVLRERAYSEKSDIFAVGYVMVEIIRERCRVAKTSQVPQSLWELIHRCLSKNPVNRPVASELEKQVDNLRDAYFVVPKVVTAGNRGSAMFPDKPCVDFLASVSQWRRSLVVEELGNEDDIPE